MELEKMAYGILLIDSHLGLHHCVGFLPVLMEKKKIL
jgi:hypothetical protein